MNVKDIQRLLAFSGYYKLGIDGDAGAGTLEAVAIVEKNHAGDYTTPPSKMSKKRRLIAAGQVILNKSGFEAGAVDGYAGRNTNTENALEAWEFKNLHGKKRVIPRKAAKDYKPVSRKNIPLQRDARKFFGTPGKNSNAPNAVRKQLVTIRLPFKLRIDYNLSQTTNKITVHKKVAKQLKAALVEAFEYYGEKEFRRLGLDRYAGAYNPRKMRFSNNWSTHAYGGAIDFYASKNGLKTRCPKALFCGPEYKAFLDIMEKHGWLPAIRLWGADGMHFQYARLK